MGILRPSPWVSRNCTALEISVPPSPPHRQLNAKQRRTLGTVPARAMQRADGTEGKKADRTSVWPETGKPRAQSTWKQKPTTSHPCPPFLCRSGKKEKRGRCRGWGEPWEHFPAPPLAPRGEEGRYFFLAAARPVMRIYFSQLRALVPSLSSSAQHSRVNERLHNEGITCEGPSEGPTGLQPHLSQN